MSGEVRYQKRFNLGNYEHEEITVAMSIDETCNVAETIENLKKLVHDAAKGVEEAVEQVSIADKNKDIDKKKKKPAKPEPEEDESEEDDAGESDDEDDEEVEETESEDDSDEEDAPAKAGKKTRSKAQNYSRSNEIHKKLFSETLKNFYPNIFKDEDGKKKAKAASMSLDGTPFLDADGEVMDEFIGALRKAVGGKKK